VLLAASALSILISVFILVYSRPVVFSYTNQTCVSDLTPFPKLLKQSNENYRVHSLSAVKIKGYPILSKKTCIHALKPPKEKANEKVSLSTPGLPLLGKHYKVFSGELPTINTEPLKEKVSIKEPILLSISQPDKVFRYRVSVAEKSVFCDVKDARLSCDVSKLGLVQSQRYSLVVERFFGASKVSSISESTITTIEPITITANSIAPGAVIYDSPTELVVTTDKLLVSAKVELVAKASQQAVIHTTSVEDKIIRIKFAKPLDRKVEYRLVLKEATAKDRAVLAKEHIVPFSTSGGPRVTATNIGRTSVEPGRTIVVTFDQTITTNQETLKQFVLTSGGVAVPFTVTASGRQAIVTPKLTLPACAQFVLSTPGTITNSYGVSGDSAWSITSRMRCYTVFSIGNSAQGRPILAYRFGTGANKVLFVGNTHGDEKATKYLLDSWVQELDVHAERIPAGKQITIVPSVSPDGFALNSRRNARGVDLNRNFPTNDWKSDVTLPGGQLAVGGGGSSALSEPETAALANVVLSERPSRILTYHSVASVVTANGIGDSDGIASAYSRLSGYRVLPKSNTATVFNYDTTGAFEDWLYEKVGISALLVELGSHTNNEFTKNKSALWAMLN
jgi:hypothetical protein